MPGETDLYFRIADNAAELPYLAQAELKPIPSIWGHRAGNPAANPADTRFVKDAVRDWLARVADSTRRKRRMAAITANNPPAVRAPTGYTHSMLITGDQRRLIISGQVGMALGRHRADTGEGQIAQAFANLRAVLAANGMGVRIWSRPLCS